MPILLRSLLFISSSSSSSSKLENHHNSLRAFESLISKSFFSQLELPPSLSWIQHCLQFILPAIEEAFAKLISEIDHPMTSWESPSLHEQYLNDSFQFLQLLNSITASVSHLQHARLTISHALSSNISSSSSSSSLKLILPFSSPSNNKKNSRWEEQKESEEEEENDAREKGYCSNKEEIIHKALLVMKRVRCCICMAVESSIRGGMELCLEERVKEAGRWWFYDSSHLSVVDQEKIRRKGMFVKEVDEINAGLSRILAGDEEDEDGKGAVAEEVKEKVDVLGKKLEGIEENVNRLFSGALARRNQLLDTLQDKGKE